MIIFLYYPLCIYWVLSSWETPLTNHYFDTQSDNVLFPFCHSMSQFFFSGKTCSWKPYSTMVTIYVSCNYLSQFLTVHCVTNYGNTQCFPVNNPWNQSIDFLTKETCCLMVSAILPIWYIHGRYGRILYIYMIYPLILPIYYPYTVLGMLIRMEAKTAEFGPKPWRWQFELKSQVPFRTF